MILSDNTIRYKNIITPFVEKGQIRGRSYGLSIASYDVRVDQTFVILPGEFRLASTIERFKMPVDVAGFVKDKSTWARVGLSCFNTFIDPGWEGFLTLELMNHGYDELKILQGDPICQIVFERVDRETEGYKGKYQLQEAGAQEARYSL